MGRESHTTADYDTSAFIFVESYDGAVNMKENLLVAYDEANLAKALLCVKPWFASRRCVILDSGFASLKRVNKGIAKHGMFAIDNLASSPPTRASSKDG